MALVGDARAYVLLRKHGALVHTLANQATILTIEGRVFILTFLLFHEYLTKDTFNEIAQQHETQPSIAAFETGKKLREVCQNWILDNEKKIKRQGNLPVYPTDLTYVQVEFLLNLLIAAQENLERAAAGGKVQ